VWVENMSSGAPMLRVTGRAQEIAESQGVSQFHVSITHTDTVAMAVVAAL
jgi:phosphopantetheinyl transferase (holo-ACP synthase)